ncbi:MAG: translation initiation factor IF-2 [Bacteroidota bacterium]
MSETEVKRLSKVAKEFNVGLSTIVDFLGNKGISIDSKPTTKIENDVYTILLKEYAAERSVKEESLQLSKVKREEKVVVEPTITKVVEEDEPQEIIIKDVTIAATPTPEKVVEKIVEAPAAEEKPVKKATAKTEEKSDNTITGPNVVGKIDLDALNQKTKPQKKSKEQLKEDREAKEEEVKAEKASKKTKKKDVVEPAAEEVKATPAKEEVVAPVAETTPEVATLATEDTSNQPAKEDFLATKYEKLEGPKIMGKIELPVAQDKKKQPIASSSANFEDPSKKKRKRIKKGINSGDDLKKFEKPATPGAPGAASTSTSTHGGGGVGRPRFNNDNRRGPNTRNTPAVKHELTQEEIQNQIKETLARLSGGSGKSKASKYRREKRQEVSDKMAEEQEMLEADKKVLRVTEFVSANELATMIGQPVTKVISTCMSLGLFVSINQRLNAETISIVAEEFGYSVSFVSAEDTVSVSEDIPDTEDQLVFRSPIVTVMGHVDHGKTSLLDYIRKANVIAGEAGGITQHIGAYSVELDNGKHITFLDTPGHEAFTAMRARGAQVTDIVIIVIAADDNVMPQTKEAINHAQAAGVPILFAFNKMDKPGANADKIREELSQMNILVEEWGGKYQTQEISAKKGTNINLLLEKVLLEAEILDLKANPNKNAVGTIIESTLDKGRGYVTTLLVQAGTLKVGDVVLAGCYSGRVKAMVNERGQTVKAAGPSAPVMMLGITGAVQSGDKFKVMDDEREARDVANKRLQLQREQGYRTHKHITLDEIGRRLAIGDFKELNVIVKGDVDGSVEALTDSLIKLSTEKIQVNVIHKSVGQVTESDVMLASASDAIIVAFQVRPTGNAKKIAELEQIDIRTYSIIYDAINEIKTAMLGMLAPEYEEKIVCNIQVREVFKINKLGTIAGCMVIDGKVTRNTKVRVIRDGIVIHTGSLGSLKRFKDDAKEVAKGFECGLNIDGFNDIEVNDIIEGYEMVETKKKL